MKIIISQNALSKALEKVKSVISSRPLTPILDYVKFEAKDKKLNITAADGETFITVECPVVINTPGDILIEANLLTEVIKSLADGDIKIAGNAEKKKAIVYVGENKFEIPAEAAELFERTSEEEYTVTQEIESSLLEEALTVTLPFVGSNEFKPAFNGVSVHFDSGMTFLSANDATQLVSMQKLPQVDVNATAHFKVPTKAANVIKATLPRFSTPVVSFNGVNVKVEADGYTLISRLIDVPFSDFRTLFPKEDAQVAIVNRAEFLLAVKRAMLFCDLEAKAYARFVFKDNQLEIYSQNLAYARKSVEKMACEFEGEIEILWNTKYLQKLLNNLVSEKAEIKMFGNRRQTVIQEAGDDNLQMIIMPIALAEPEITN